MRIENCIEDFVISVYTQKPQLFCNLLCPLDMSKLRKELYTNKNYISVDSYIKENYLEKISHLVSLAYNYECYKRGDKYIVKYYFLKNKNTLQIEFNTSLTTEGKEVINLDTAKIQASV
ncbi:hypothetical protein G5S33_02526 [Staphylococcus cohnii subsp. cohnii]|uniref:hypothetical protein n=1 Tax=Staphylococcus cohnii TaxID=29382 RepID=UPI0016032E0D|nr:hypothetical protein [Staphylococcus cohnii]MBB2509080.1 hypothetical protein [Staphylococcus cohnii subsp. barensis]